MDPRLLQALLALGMIVVGAVPAVYWARVKGVRVSPFVWGMLAWIVTVAVKFAIALPLNQPFLRFLVLSVSPSLASLIFNTYIGFLTSITECGLLYIAVRLTTLRSYAYKEIIAFGIAFGATEAVLLGVRQLLGVLSIESAVVAQLPVPHWAVLERTSTLLLHVLACALIFYSVSTRRFYLFWISFAAKGVTDGLASWYLLGLLGGGSPEHVGWLYAAIILLGVTSALGLYWLMRWQRMVSQVEEACHDVEPIGQV